jgi:peptidoglycan/xylan/chitin deacetylase (PgdA/CDA1 family)
MHMSFHRRFRHRRAAVELAVIFFIGALLAVSVFGLIGRAVSANGGGAYPNLYAGDAPRARSSPEKTAYFTFDDGPSENTALILDMLAEEDVRATFFVTAQGEDEKLTAELLNRMVTEGHTIGLHSYSHNFSKIYDSADSYLKDIDRLNTYIIEQTGYRPQILRFPGSSRTVNASKSVMAEIIDEITGRGYLYYDWDVVSGDDTDVVYSAETLAQNMLDGVKKHSSVVFLCHDNSTPKTTAEAVRLVIRQLRDEGWSFDRLSPAVEPVHIH